MDPDSWLALAGAVLGGAVLAFAAAAQSALGNVRRGKIRRLAEEGVSGAGAIEHLLARPDILNATFVIVDSLALLAASILAILVLTRLLAPDWSAVAAGVFATLVLLLLLQIVPRGLAEKNPIPTALFIVNFVRLIAWLFSPITSLFGVILDGISALAGSRRQGAAEEEGDEEELAVLEELEEGGTEIEATEREMIKGIIGLEDTTVREIMVPRVDIIAAEANEPLSKIRELIVQHGRSRIPIYEESIDNIVGIVYAKDLLRYVGSGESTIPLRDIARPAYFIPESKKIGELLEELQQRKVHIAIVVDEYGGTAGMVTIEDLLEQIVGEIEDEYDREEARIQRISDEEAILDGRTHIDELRELFGLRIEGDAFDTVGGFVYSQLGRIPNVGDEIRVNSLTISVLSTLGRRVKKVRVWKGEAPSPLPSEAQNPTT